MRKLFNLRDLAEGLSIHGDIDIFMDYLSVFHKAIRNAGKFNFSNLISINSNNSRLLFSTIDSLINPAPKVDGLFFWDLRHALEIRCFRD